MYDVKGNRTFDVTEDFLHIWLAVKIKKQGNKPINYSTDGEPV